MPPQICNLKSEIPQSHLSPLPKCHLLYRPFHGRGEIMERVRTLVLIQSKITQDVVGIGAQFVGEISDAIIVAEGNEKINVLKQNYYLNNEFYDLKYQKIEYRVEKPDKNIHSRFSSLLHILHDFLPVSS
jgi:hypothetical protein